MLSAERIRQIADDIYCSEGTHAEIEHSIRAALAEAAQVPVMGEVVAYGVPNSAITGMRHRLMQVMLDIPRQAQYPELLVPLFEKPTTCISSKNTEWSKPCETGSWSLFWRDWKKVETDREIQP